MPAENEQERLASTLSGPIAHSPTGTPITAQWQVRLAFFVVAVATVAHPLVPEGRWKTAAAFVMGLGALYGIASPGVRK